MTPILWILYAGVVAWTVRLLHVCAELRRGWGATPLLRVRWRR